MTYSADELKKRAKKRLVAIKRRQADPRYARVVGRLCEAGYLETNTPVARHAHPIKVEDALWVGKVEPRVLELLPALIVKSRSLFEQIENLPADLADVVRALRRHQVPPDFRGIPGQDVERWLPRVGRKDKLPSRLKAFRFQAADVRLLRDLSAALDLNETEVLRRSLRDLASRVLFASSTPP